MEAEMGKIGKIGKTLISEAQIKQRVKELAEEISRAYTGKVPTLVSVLKGGIVFLTDLMREITVLHEVDFM